MGAKPGVVHAAPPTAGLFSSRGALVRCHLNFATCYRRSRVRFWHGQASKGCCDQGALIVELDWSPAALEQAEDRVHRIGQAGQVTITYLRGRDTLDDRMLSILDRKRAVIRKIASGDAPFGFKADGTPRQRPAGPGRTPLENSVRDERRKSSRARWQAAHPEYMRDYMRARRLAKRVESAKRDIDDHEQLLHLGFEVIQREMGGRSVYSRKDYEAELQRAAAKADAARVFLVSNSLDVREPAARQPTQGGRDSHVP